MGRAEVARDIEMRAQSGEGGAAGVVVLVNSQEGGLSGCQLGSKRKGDKKPNTSLPI